MDGTAPCPRRSPDDIKMQSPFWPHSHTAVSAPKPRNYPPITEELLRGLITDYLARFEGDKMTIMVTLIADDENSIAFVNSYGGQVSIAGLVQSGNTIFPLAGGIKLTTEGAWQIVELHHEIPHKKK